MICCKCKDVVMQIDHFQYKRCCLSKYLETKIWLTCPNCGHESTHYHAQPFNPSHRYSKDVKVNEKWVEVNSHNLNGLP